MSDDYEIFDDTQEEQTSEPVSDKKDREKMLGRLKTVCVVLLVLVSFVNMGFCIQIYRLLTKSSDEQTLSLLDNSLLGKISDNSGYVIDLPTATVEPVGAQETTTTLPITVSASPTTENSAGGVKTTAAPEEKTTVAAAAAPSSAQNKQPDSERININTATAEELTALSGIGEKKAQAIVDYREENGAFQSVEDLTNVSGIGEKTLEKNINLITVG